MADEHKEPAGEAHAPREEKRRIVQRKEVVVTLPVVKVPGWLQGFTDFVREQGVVGLAVGLVLGTQVKTLVDSLVAGFINPLIGLLTPGGGDLASKKFYLTIHGPGKGQDFRYGQFLAQVISFVIVAAVIYFTVRRLKLDRLDKKKI